MRRQKLELAAVASGGAGNLTARVLVFVTNGISRDHQEYLALGGQGFLLGDGRLNYGRENIIETYYTLHMWRGIYPSFGLQHIKQSRVQPGPGTSHRAGASPSCGAIGPAIRNCLAARQKSAN